LGSQYGVTRENVRQYVKRATEKLHEASPDELKDRFDTDQFDFRKPTTMKQKFKLSESHGGKLEGIVRLIDEGKSFDEILKSTELSSKQLYNVKTNARSFAVEIPYRTSNPIRELKLSLQRLSDKNTSIEEAQQILDRLSVSVYRRNYEAIIRIADIVKDLGFTIQSPVSPTLPGIVVLLKLQGIPARALEHKSGIRIMRYGILAEADKERATEYLGSQEYRDELARLKKKKPTPPDY